MRTYRFSLSPAYDPALGARRNDTTLGWQIHWTNIVSKADWRGQVQQSDVIIKVIFIIVVVRVDAMDVTHDLLVRIYLLCPHSQVHTQV